MVYSCCYFQAVDSGVINDGLVPRDSYITSVFRVTMRNEKTVAESYHRYICSSYAILLCAKFEEQETVCEVHDDEGHLCGRSPYLYIYEAG